MSAFTGLLDFSFLLSFDTGVVSLGNAGFNFGTPNYFFLLAYSKRSLPLYTLCLLA